MTTSDRNTSFINSPYITNGYYNIIRMTNVNKVNPQSSQSILLVSIENKKSNNFAYLGEWYLYSIVDYFGYDLRENKTSINYPSDIADKILVTINKQNNIEVMGLNKEDNVSINVYLHDINKDKIHIADISYDNIKYFNENYMLSNDDFLGYVIEVKNTDGNIIDTKIFSR